MFLDYLQDIVKLLDQGIAEIKHHFAQCVAMAHTPVNQRGPPIMSMSLGEMKRSCRFEFDFEQRMQLVLCVLQLLHHYDP